MVGNLTLAQQLMYLEPDESSDDSESTDPASDTIHFDNLEDAVAYRQERQALMNG